MGNLNCGSGAGTAGSQEEGWVHDQSHHLRTSSPIKIQEIEGEGLEPLLTTVRGKKNHQQIVQRLLGESKDKKKKTDKQMGQFIDGLLERGRQSNRYLDSLRKQKLVNETKARPVKQLSFNLNKFLTNQQEFLEKRNMSLERSRETLFASRTAEETYHPKINHKSRKIAIQVSSRNILNKKKVVLKNSKQEQSVKQNNQYKHQSKTQKKGTQYFSAKKSSGTKKTNDDYLRNKLHKQLNSCCESLEIGQDLNYLQFTEVLQQMSFAKNDMKQRAMLLEGWNLLAGNRLTINRELVFSFILSLFGLDSDPKDLFQAECRSVEQNYSPQRLRGDLDDTYLSVQNQKRPIAHQDTLNFPIMEYIQEEYKPLRYNRINLEKDSSPYRSKQSSLQKPDRQAQNRIRANQCMSNSYRSKVVEKAEFLHLLQPRFKNKNMSGYQINQLSQSILKKQIHEIQFRKEVDELRECTFHPETSPNRKSNPINIEHYFSYSAQSKYDNQQTNTKKKPQPILQIQVNIGTKVEKIIIFEGDNTDQIADEFLTQNNLPTIFRDKLVTMISEGLAKIEE